MPKLTGHNTKLENKETKDGKEIKEGELPPALQKAIDAKKDKEKKENSGDKKKEKSDGAEVRIEDDEKKDEKKKEIDVKEHVDALVAGEKDLTDEFKTKAATIFEAAIKSKVKEIEEEMETDYTNKFEQESAKEKAELTEKVDSTIIGGAIIRMGDKQLDASVSKAISELRQIFNKNLYIQDF